MTMSSRRYPSAPIVGVGAVVPISPATIVLVRRTGKGSLSYLVGSEGEAAVIDPSVSPDV